MLHSVSSLQRLVPPSDINLLLQRPCSTTSIPLDPQATSYSPQTVNALYSCGPHIVTLNGLVSVYSALFLCTKGPFFS